MRKLVLCLALLGATSAWMIAQESSDKGKSDTRTVTGCLQKTSHNNQFLLLANDADHVGHTVTATGTVSNSTAHNMKEDTKDMAHDTGVKKDNSEHGTLKVTDVQMVSDSCSK